MIKIVIPVTLVATIITTIAVLTYIADITPDIQQGDFDEAANKTTERIVEEVEDEANNALIAPFIPYLIVGVVAIGKIFGILFIFK